MLLKKCQPEYNKTTISENYSGKTTYSLNKEDNLNDALSTTNSKNEWPLLKKISALQSLSTDEIDVLLKLHEKKIVIDAKKIFLHQNSINRQCFIVNSGWAYRYKDHMNGERQIINYILPGDIISPLSLVNPKKKYSIASITNLHVSVLKPEYLMDLYTAQPKLFSLYIEILDWENAMLIEQMTCIGWLTAYQRTVYLLLNLYERLKLVGCVENHTFYAPLTQQLLADTLSLSIVHVNRTIKRLRDDNLIKMESNEIELLDIPSLKQIVGALN
jgi:CRP-like cAMP-binding protein